MRPFVVLGDPVRRPILEALFRTWRERLDDPAVEVDRGRQQRPATPPTPGRHEGDDDGSATR